MVLAKSRNGRKLNKALKISNPKVALENRIRLSISHNVQGLALLGYLKNCCSAFVLLFIEDNQIQTFSKAHIAQNRMLAAGRIALMYFSKRNTSFLLQSRRTSQVCCASDCRNSLPNQSRQNNRLYAKSMLRTRCKKVQA